MAFNFDTFGNEVAQPSKNTNKQIQKGKFSFESFGVQSQPVEDQQKDRKSVFQARTKAVGQFIAPTITESLGKLSKGEKLTGRDVIGSGLEAASFAVPAGGIAKGIGLAGKGALTLGKKLIGGAITGGVTGGLSSAGESVGKGDEIGDVAKKTALGVVGGTAIGGVIPLAGAGVKKVLGAPSFTAPRVINSLIKPLKKDLSYGKNPGRAVSEEGIVANSMEDLLDKVSLRRQEIGNSIRTQLERSNKKISLDRVLNPIDEALENARKTPRTNAALIQRLQSLKSDILGEEIKGGKTLFTRRMVNVSPAEAWEVKKIIGDLTKFTGNVSDDNLVNKSLKRVYGQIKERINNAVPNLAKLNERYADLTSAEIATKYRNEIIERQSLIGFSPQVTGLSSALLGAILSGGALTPALVAGLAGAAGRKLMQSTAFKTRLASALVKMSPAERDVLIKGVSPEVRNILNKLITQQAGRAVSNFGTSR